MARKKSSEHKFRNPQLNAPILAYRPSLTATDKDTAKMAGAVTAEQARKFNLLFAEFEIDRGDPKSNGALIASLSSLAYKLACLYVPGMQMTFDRPGRGAPKKREGLGSNPALLLGMVDLAKHMTGIESDKKAVEYVLLSQEPDLKSPKRKTERDKRVRTLANLVSKARTDAAQPRH
jgi:hypothetical protein